MGNTPKYQQRPAPAGVSRAIGAMKYDWYECGIHDLKYHAFRAGCPVCESDRQVKDLRTALTEVKAQLKITTEDAHKLRVQVDFVVAIREASTLLDDEDLAFLKTTLYAWRDEKSLGLKTTHGARKKERKGDVTPPNGFIVMPRRGDPYGHLCSSMGGLAIAQYFFEATNSVGPANAMMLLARGMASHLPGSLK